MKSYRFTAIYSAVLCALLNLSCGSGSIEYSEYQPVIRRNPDTAGEFFNLGTAMSILGRDDKAADAFSEAVRLDPGDSESLFGLGLSLSILGREREAADAFGKALALGIPETTHYKLGIAYYTVGRFADAVGEFEQSLRNSEPHPATTSFRLGLAYTNLGKYREGLAAFERALAMNPDIAAGYLNIFFYAGINLQVLGETDKALEAYETSLRYRPDFPFTYLNLGILHADRGDFESARDCLGRLLKLDVELADKLGKHIESRETGEE